MSERIVVRRSGALGDVILTTPVIRRLAFEYPKARIGVETYYRDVFRNNPLVFPPPEDYGYDSLINLNLAYELRPSMHIVEAYMLQAFGDEGKPEDLQQELFLPERPQIRLNPARTYVAVHAAQAGWKNRTLPSATWKEVCERLQRAKLVPILVGTERDMWPLPVPKLSIPDIIIQASMISFCACFVGSDTSLLHAAGATMVPIVGVFTSVRPEYRLPYRNGVLGFRCKAVVPDLPCVGCHARQPVPTTTESCEVGGIPCVRAVSAKVIVDAVLEIIE